jgi:hypothetical protein
MPKNIILILIFLLIITAVLIWRLFFFVPSPNFVNIKIADTNYKIELAKTSAQKIKGLSKRNTLCSNCGMLFIFGFETELPFWMKDTLIPLDMIWLDKNGKIVDIKTTDKTNSKKIYQNQSPAQYVLELNANDYQKLNLKIGDIIQLPNTL